MSKVRVLRLVADADEFDAIVIHVTHIHLRFAAPNSERLAGDRRPAPDRTRGRRALLTGRNDECPAYRHAQCGYEPIRRRLRKLPVLHSSLLSVVVAGSAAAAAPPVYRRVVPDAIVNRNPCWGLNILP